MEFSSEETKVKNMLNIFLKHNYESNNTNGEAFFYSYELHLYVYDQILKYDDLIKYNKFFIGKKFYIIDESTTNIKMKSSIIDIQPT